MNAKFYVPFETAKLLKEKGYPQGDSDMWYNQNGCLILSDLSPFPFEEYTSAPAYCEVIDWLAVKEIYIDVDRTGYLLFESGLRWQCYIWERDEKRGCRITRGYGTREQAINAAIIKILKDVI